MGLIYAFFIMWILHDCRRDAYIRCLRYIPKAKKLKALQSWTEVADSKVSRW